MPLNHVLNFLPLFCCPPPVMFESMLDEMEASDEDEVVVGDFCSILIIAGVPENDVVAMRLLDVVTSDT